MTQDDMDLIMGVLAALFLLVLGALLVVYGADEWLDRRRAVAELIESTKLRPKVRS